MDIIDKLGNRIDTLLASLETLRAENRGLKEHQTAVMEPLEQDNQRLKTELEEFKAANETVMQRLDDLLKKLATLEAD